MGSQCHRGDREKVLGAAEERRLRCLVPSKRPAGHVSWKSPASVWAGRFRQKLERFPGHLTAWAEGEVGRRRWPTRGELWLPLPWEGVRVSLARVREALGPVPAHSLRGAVVAGKSGAWPARTLELSTAHVVPVSGRAALGGGESVALWREPPPVTPDFHVGSAHLPIQLPAHGLRKMAHVGDPGEVPGSWL